MRIITVLLLAISISAAAGCSHDGDVGDRDLSPGVRDLSASSGDAFLRPDAADLRDGGDGGAGPASFVPTVPCTDTADDVYVTPAGLPALTPAAQGDVVRCRRDADQDLDGAAVDTALSSEGVSLGAASSGVAIYRIAFRTTRANGTAAASTARVYVPTSPAAFPMPLVVVGHPTEGMGDSCATSKDSASMHDVSLPWAAHGYAVIAPDYTGFGNEGIPGYLDNRDQGYSLLDGARALRKLFPGGVFTDKIVIEGWSQGGGAALSAQALAKTYGAGGTVAAIVAFAPEWPIRNNSFAFADMVNNPNTFIAFDPTNMNLSYSNHVIWTQRAYGYFANFSALTTSGAAAFPASTGGTFVTDMNNLCGEVAIGGAIYAAAKFPVGAKNGDLFDPTFRTALAACFADPTSAGCTGLGKEYYTYMGVNHLTSDSTGAPILLVQGLLDTVLPPAKEAACIVAKLTTENKAPMVCVDASAQHTNVTTRNIAYAIHWVDTLLAGQQLPACPDATSMLPAASCN